MKNLLLVLGVCVSFGFIGYIITPKEHTITVKDNNTGEIINLNIDHKVNDLNLNDSVLYSTVIKNNIIYKYYVCEAFKTTNITPDPWYYYDKENDMFISKQYNMAIVLNINKE